MKKQPQFAGSIVALVTPMHPNGEIDWEALQQLIDWHIEAGSDGIVAVGTTGESPTLDMDEHAKVIADIIKHSAGRIPVIAGTGGNSTAEAIQLTQQACADGADACLSVVPYYNKPTQQGLIEHFTAIADVASKPILLYNVPTRTITDLADTTVAELAQHSRIGGVKDATGNLARLKWQLANIDVEDFCFLSGDDSTCRSYVTAGGHGTISVTANVAPKMMHDMIAAARTGAAQAATIDAELADFHQVQGVVANPMPVKWALHDTGRIGAGIRLPLTPLPAAHHASVRAAVSKLH